MPESNSVPNGFRKIPGFPRYAIDEHGTVLSVCPRNGKGKDRPWENAERKSLKIDSHGYHRVNLYTADGVRREKTIHALVLETFVGPCPDGMECRHLDGNKTNNHKDNLAWGTRSENALDKVLHGTQQWVGEQNSKSKLAPADVLEIRRRAANGEKPASIANDFPVDHTSISKIILRKTWAHVASAETTKFFNDRHDARVASGNQSLYSD